MDFVMLDSVAGQSVITPETTFLLLKPNAIRDPLKSRSPQYVDGDDSKGKRKCKIMVIGIGNLVLVMGRYTSVLVLVLS
jgi:hypothetical protein